MTQAEIKIEFLGGEAPVQAQGSINGKAFFFHARWDGWAFAVALDPSIDPSGIARSDEHSYYIEGDFGKPGGYEASYMSIGQAEKIIQNCIKTFQEHMLSM